MARELSSPERKELVHLRFRNTQLKHEVAAMKELLDTATLTPRRMIYDRLIQRGFSTKHPENDNPSEFPLRCSANSLTRDFLDVPMNRQQAARFKDSLETSEVRFQVSLCDVCSMPKLRTKQQGDHEADEFMHLSGLIARCASTICKDCYGRSITNTLLANWWCHLASGCWIECPAPKCAEGCPGVLGNEANLASIVRATGVKDVQWYMDTFRRILIFRDVLRTITDPSVLGSLSVAGVLWQTLNRNGLMHSPLNPCLATTTPDENGRIPPFNPGSIRIITVTHKNKTHKVPIFMRLLCRKTTPTTCIICADTVHDLVSIPSSELDTITNEFSPDLVHQLYHHPISLLCNHPITFCTSCLSQHITSRLSLGRTAATTIPCPDHNCRRPLARSEIRTYATPAAFALYDKYLTLNHLSSDPTFRWCLGPGCTNGQLVDSDRESDGDDTIDPRYTCDECGYIMCFTHSTPWHEGLTCEEENTKACPGSQCYHEFCWACLANWKDIERDEDDENGGYNQEGHKEGCYFRRADVDLRPTQVFGRTLEVAITDHAQ
ncbi:hypothetical protein OQA88_3435 [Cercophora sp. LCS_1]